MGVDLTRLFKGTAIYGVASVFQRFILLLLLPFYTRALAPEEYGVVALVSLISVAVSGLFNLGTGSSMGILYFERDKSDRPAVVWSTFGLLVLNSSAVLLCLAILSPAVSRLIFETADHAGLLRIALVTLAVTTLVEPFYAYLRYEERAQAFVLFAVLSAVLGAVFSILLVLVFPFGPAGLLAAALLAQLFTASTVAFFVARKLQFHFDLALLRPLVRIGFPSVFGLFAFLLIDYADRQMLQRMIGIDAVGVYSVGYNLAMAMLIAVSAFGMAWPPFFVSFVNRQEEAKRLFGRVLTYYFVGAGLLTAIFFLFARPLVAILAPEYVMAVQVIGLVAAAYMLKGAYLILVPGLYFAKKLYLQSMVEWGAALSNIGLNLLLIPLWGIVGAAFATLGSYIILVLLAWAVARRYLRVEYPWLRLLIALATIGVGCGWIYWASETGPALAQVLHGVAALTAMCGAFAWLVLVQEERDWLRGGFKRLLA